MKLESYYTPFPHIRHQHLEMRWLRDHIEHEREQYDIEYIFDTLYQRDYVWTLKDQISWLEHIFLGGQSGLDLYWNQTSDMSNVEIVDGKQRMLTLFNFLDNNVPVFGKYWNEFEEYPKLPRCYYFNVHKLELPTQKDVIEFYIRINSTGVSHTDEELNKAKGLLLL